MQVKRPFIPVAAAILTFVSTVPASAQERNDRMFLIEGTGAWGAQIGRTDYLPDGSLTQYQHPMVLGWAVGGTAGVFLAPGIAPIVNYEYTWAQSRTGEAPPFLDSVEGKISYHTIVAGLRIYKQAGFGRLRAELAFGLVLPFQTEVTFDYGSGLAPAITGTGSQISEYSLGVGGHGLMAYELPLGDIFYIAPGVKIKAFQSENSDEVARRRNFVDPNAEFPVPETTTIEFGDGAERPTTYSEQDIRLQVAVGASF